MNLNTRMPENFAQLLDGGRVQVRRLGVHEVHLHRELRLHALSEASDFLGATFSEAARQPSDYWEELTWAVTGTSSGVMYVALEGERPVGSVYGLPDHERREVGRVVGMWVHPMWRRRGIGRAFIERVIVWARERSFVYLLLWAPAHSLAAIDLYVQAGFRTTGSMKTVSIDTEIDMIEMKAEL